MQIGVVGAGIIGLSLARALQQAGHIVTVYDQAAVPNPLASSVDGSRLIRHAYGRHLGYAAMVDDAYAAWERLWADLGERLYRRTGTLVLSAPGETWARDSAETMDRIGQSYEWLDGEAAARRFPLLEVSALADICFVPSGGVLQADAIVAALARRVTRLGGAVHAESRIAAVDLDGGTLRLESGDEVAHDLLILSAGPWTGELLPELARRLTPSRQVVCYGEIPEALQEQWAEMPMVLEIGKDSPGFYAVPPVFGGPLKVGDHAFTLTGDPDRERFPEADECAEIFERAGGRVRDFQGYRLIEGKTCFYTVAEEERFLVARRERGFVFAGFSGHGFKFGPLIGERFADMLAGKLSHERFIRWIEGRGA